MMFITDYLNNLFTNNGEGFVEVIYPCGGTPFEVLAPNAFDVLHLVIEQAFDTCEAPIDLGNAVIID